MALGQIGTFRLNLPEETTPFENGFIVQFSFRNPNQDFSRLGCLLILLADSVGMLTLYGSVVGAGVGLFLTANWALANRLAPSENAGLFIGLTNIATAGSGAVGRLWGPVLDALNQPAAGIWTGYTTMFIAGAVCTAASAILLTKVKE